MKVLVTGATGFVGGYICAALLENGLEVVGLSRGGQSNLPTGVTAAQGDVTTGEGLAAAMAGVNAVIHLVGIIREKGALTFERVHVEGTRNVIATAQAANVPRLVHMSALGADVAARSNYQSSKGRAEALVGDSKLEWTIMRPSLIFGVGDDFFAGTLRELVTLPPVIPVVGRGDQPFRPIWAVDVATAFARALDRPATADASFDLVGPREYTLRDLLLKVRAALQVNKPLLSVPLPLMRLGVMLFRLLPNPPITPDQFLMLLAGNTGDPRPGVEAFGLELAELEDHLGQIMNATQAGKPGQRG